MCFLVSSGSVYFPILQPCKFVDIFVFGKAVPYSKSTKAAEGGQFLSIAICSYYFS